MLPPEDLLDAAHVPSLWRVWDVTLRLLLAIVFGNLAPDDLLRASRNVHHRLAHSRRRRRPHISYPTRH